MCKIIERGLSEQHDCENAQHFGSAGDEDADEHGRMGVVESPSRGTKIAASGRMMAAAMATNPA
jgi:hypothetical protein